MVFTSAVRVSPSTLLRFACAGKRDPPVPEISEAVVLAPADPPVAAHVFVKS